MKEKKTKVKQEDSYLLLKDFKARVLEVAF